MEECSMREQHLINWSFRSAVQRQHQARNGDQPWRAEHHRPAAVPALIFVRLPVRLTGWYRCSALNGEVEEILASLFR